MANTIGTNAAPGNTYADPGIYYDRKFLERLSPQLVLKECGDKRPLPTKSGTLVKWHRLNKLAAATTPLNENANPAEVTSGTSVVTVEPLTYGSWVKVSAELNLKSINPIVEEIMDEQADQAALTYDDVIFSALHGNVTNQFAGAVANEGLVADASVLNASEVRKAVYALRKNNVPGFEGNMYKLVIHPASQFDITSDNAVGSWIDIHKYTTPDPLMKGEIGMLYGARVVVTQNLPTGTGLTDETFRSFLFGRQAFGVTELSGNGIKTFRYNQGSTENPLDMYSTIGWKFMMAAKVLQASRAIEIYSGSAAE
jgi:N4-gp56 family major capsid protein